MKAKPLLRYSNFPLRITEVQQSKKEIMPLLVLYANDVRKLRFPFIENQSIQDAHNWDLAWYTNYE
jgi:hypothetical protein